MTIARPSSRGSRRGGLLAVLVLSASACAREAFPPGGERDRLPPVVIAVRPEALSQTEDLRRRIRVQFNERISERPTSGQLDDAVLVSPATGTVRVEHERDALEVDMSGGLRPGLVYLVSVRPVIRDMFGNAMREPFEFVFSTGGEFHETAVAGLVVDRLTGRPAAELVVRVVAQEEREAERPVAHVARTDTAGLYTLRYLPPGGYDLVAFEDRDRDQFPDPFELQGRRELSLTAADTVFMDLPIMEPDTSAARLARAEVVDSATVRLSFTDYLDPDASLAAVGATLARTDGGAAPAVRQLLDEHRWVVLQAAADSAAAADAAAADTAAVVPPPDTLVADSLAADTLGADTRRRAAPRVATYVGRAQGADSAAAALLGLTLPSRVVYVELSDSLAFDVGYVLRIEGIVNLAGIRSAVDTVLISRDRPEAPPPAPARDTAAVRDTAEVRDTVGRRRPWSP